MTLCPGISRHGMASQRTLLLVSSSCKIVQFTLYMTIKNIEDMPYEMSYLRLNILQVNMILYFMF